MNTPTAQQVRTVARFAATAVTMTGLALMAAGRWTWTHRQQIAAELIRFIAAMVVAGQAAYAAGCWTRRQLLNLSDQAARLTAAQPIPALAPITAGLAALREALALLIARPYPEPAQA